MAQSYFLSNVRAILPASILPLGNLAVVNGRLAALEARRADFPHLEMIDGGGHYVAPGFFDVHCHGDGEHCFFSEGEVVAENLLRNGTTSVLATLSYFDMTPGQLSRQVAAYWEGRGPQERKLVVGMHLEGPYINYRYGAGSHYCVPRDPQPAEYSEVLARWGGSVVRQWTLAPELPGSVAFAKAAHKAGVVLAAGHTEAALSDLEAVVDNGLRVATHWSNASGRPGQGGGVVQPGIDEFALESDALFAEIICDSGGHHVHPLMTRLLYKTKGFERILLITDATRMKSVRQASFNEDVNFNADGQLSGSRLTMPAAARNFRKVTGCTLPEIFCMGALNPARLHGLDGEIGSIAPGKRANLLLIDEAITLKRVFNASLAVL